CARQSFTMAVAITHSDYW
nr:immunoglobulin heavy chain junction region [Macaca mulatta]MOX06339.1 immunoglobulin heavy chain junction region [Macaca mulatta]MOX06928.1 immunoglobulin heavy chain junction region [Macaca mulatta]